MAVRAFVDRLLPGQDWGLILLASGALLAVYLFNSFLWFVITYWGHMLGINIETEMRRRAFDHLQKLSFSYLRQPEDRPSGRPRDQGPRGGGRGRPSRARRTCSWPC